MKKMLILKRALVALALLSSVVATSCANPSPTPLPTSAPTPAPASAPKLSTPPTTYKLIVGYYYPENHNLHIAFRKVADLVAQRSNGRLVLELHPGGTLVGTSNFADLASSGSVDITSSASLFMEGMVGGYAAYQLPGLFNNSAHTVRAWKAGWGDIVNDEWQKKFKLISLPSELCAGSHVLMSKKPVIVPSDMKGMVIRTSTKAMAEYVGKFGASGESMATSDMYMAFSTGTLNGAIAALYTVVTYKWYEVLSDVTHLRLADASAPILMNINKWNALPNDLQQILKNTLAEVMEKEETEKMGSDRADEENYAAATKKGIQVRNLTPEQEALWRAGAKDIWAKWAASLAYGQKILDIVEKTRTP